MHLWTTTGFPSPSLGVPRAPSSRSPGAEVAGSSDLPSKPRTRRAPRVHLSARPRVRPDPPHCSRSALHRSEGAGGASRAPMHPVPSLGAGWLPMPSGRSRGRWISPPVPPAPLRPLTRAAPSTHPRPSAARDRENDAAVRWRGVARERIDKLTCHGDGDGKQQQLMEQQGGQELGGPHGAGGPPPPGGWRGGEEEMAPRKDPVHSRSLEEAE